MRVEWMRKQSRLLKPTVVVLVYVTHNDRDSSVGVATNYGFDGPGIEFRWGTRPDRPWCPPILLYGKYRVFLDGKAAGAWR